jgi:hypothetical protein
VFIVERYLVSKLFAAVREARTSGYPDEEVQNKITVHRLIVKFRVTGSSGL